MIYSLLTFLRRFISRNLLSSSLKSFGLWLGMLVFTIVFLIHGFHTSYDSWNPMKDQIYKVAFQSKGSDYMGSDKYGVTSAVLAPMVNEKLPQVEVAIRIDEVNDLLFKIGDEAHLVELGAAVDSEGIEMIGIKMIMGPESNAIPPYSVLLSESLAEKLFGNKDPVGQIITPETTYRLMSSYTVAGVYQDMQLNSTFQYSYLLPFEDYLKDINPNSLEQWGNRNYYTFFRIKPNQNLAQIEDIITSFRNENQEGSDNDFRYFLQPLTSLHFSEGINFEIGESINMSNLNALLLIGLIILLISAFNSVNLSIAETFQRQLEMGVRKTFGASRTQLIFQYIFETSLQMLVITSLTIVTIYLILPVLNATLGFNLSPLDNRGFIPLLAVMNVVIILLTAGYPAIVLSRAHAGKNLRNSQSTGFFGLRNSLVVVQFFLAGVLIVISVGIYQQINYLLDTDPGFEREGIMVLRMQDRDIRRNEEIRRSIKIKALAHPQIESVAYSSQLPNRITSQNGRMWTDDSGQERAVSLYTLIVEPELMDIYDIKMVDGRLFLPDFDSNKGRYILNEAAVKEIGIEDILHQTFIENKDTIEIIGIMKDFHGLSMHQPIRPTRFSVEDISWWGYCSVQFKGDPQVVKSFVTGLFNEYSDFPVTAELFDSNYLRLYEEEQQTRERIALLTGLAIFLSCLGLFGLLLNAFENKQLELGIRKTLGATLGHLGWILSRRLLLPIGIAWICAMPIAAYLLERWLDSFSYRIALGATSFTISAILLAISVAGSLLYMMVRISDLNPIDILKEE